jgi:hypothetical protein
MVTVSGSAVVAKTKRIAQRRRRVVWRVSLGGWWGLSYYDWDAIGLRRISGRVSHSRDGVRYRLAIDVYEFPADADGGLLASSCQARLSRRMKACGHPSVVGRRV